MYQISLSIAERELVLTNLFSRIVHLREKRDRWNNEIWEKSIFYEELIMLEGLFAKISSFEEGCNG